MVCVSDLTLLYVGSALLIVPRGLARASFLARGSPVYSSLSLPLFLYCSNDRLSCDLMMLGY
jgi:hypothetical protein